MTKEQVARILFAYTRDWREDPSSPGQVQATRRVLASAIWSAPERFPAAQEPSLDDLGDAAGAGAAWQDCSSAAAQTRADAAPSRIYVLGQTPPREDAFLLQDYPALASASPIEELGPFLVSPSRTPYHLHVFDAVGAIAPGFYSARATPRAAATLISRFRHAWLAALLFLVALAAFCGVNYGAYRAGGSITPAAVAPQALPQRLAASIARSDERLRSKSRILADKILIKSELATSTGEVRTPEAAFLAQPLDKPGAPPRALRAGAGKPLAAEEVATLVTAVENGARTVLSEGYPKEDIPPAARKDAIEAAAKAAARAVAQDPYLSPRTVNLAGWWIAAMAVLVVIAGLIGRGLKGTVFGVLIDGRNRLSLSTLQLALWTVIVLGLFSVTSSFLLAVSGATMLLPTYEWHIWALLGLSVGAQPLSGLILLAKTGQAPDPVSQERINADATSGNKGLLETKLSPDDWSFLDFFRGEELTNRDQVDISRFQFFVITICLMTVFVGMTGQLLWSLPMGGDWVKWAKESAHPGLNKTFIGLLALSHGGYLGIKALPKP